MAQTHLEAGLQVVAYDFGTKHNILRRLASHGCKITVVPADYPADKVIDLNPDGIFLSNGPVSMPSAPCHVQVDGQRMWLHHRLQQSYEPLMKHAADASWCPFQSSTCQP